MKHLNKIIAVVIAAALALSMFLIALADDPNEPDWREVAVKASADDVIEDGAYYLDLASVKDELINMRMITGYGDLVKDLVNANNLHRAGLVYLKSLYPDLWAAAVTTVKTKYNANDSDFEEGQGGWKLYEAEEDYFFPGILAIEDEALAMLNEKIAAQRTKYEGTVYAHFFAYDLTKLIVETLYNISMDMGAFETLGYLFLAEEHTDAFEAVATEADAYYAALTQARWFVDFNFSANPAMKAESEDVTVDMNYFTSVRETFVKNAAWQQVKPSEAEAGEGDYYIDADALTALYEEKFRLYYGEDAETGVIVDPVNGPTFVSKAEYIAWMRDEFLTENTLFVNPEEPSDGLFEIRMDSVRTESFWDGVNFVTRTRERTTYLPMAEKTWASLSYTTEQLHGLIRYLAPTTPTDPTPATPTDPTPATPTDPTPATPTDPSEQDAFSQDPCSLCGKHHTGSLLENFIGVIHGIIWILRSFALIAA